MASNNDSPGVATYRDYKADEPKAADSKQEPARAAVPVKKEN